MNPFEEEQMENELKENAQLEIPDDENPFKNGDLTPEKLA